jgi:FAD/FMN-containing dehydrogenase
MAVKCQEVVTMLGARYGLVADLMLELTVVTPDGKIVMANAF